LTKIAFLESLGIFRQVLSIVDGFFQLWMGSIEYGRVHSSTNATKIPFCYFTHLGVVKVGLIWLANLEAFEKKLEKKIIFDIR